VYESGVDAVRARQALATVVPRLTALIRSVRNPAAHAVGEWNAGQVAVHLAQAWEVLGPLSRGETQVGLERPEDLAAFTISLVRGEDCSDVHAAADRIDAAAAAYFAKPLDDLGLRSWLFAGTELPASAFVCHLLNESLVHGFDIARADRQRWRIEPAHAGMAILGFLLPALSVLDPHFPVVQEEAAGVRACVDVRLRRTGRFFLVLDDGTLHVEPPTDRPVDWHLSADPTALFLQLWSRTGVVASLLSGRVVGWGRRPQVGLRLPRMLRSP